MTADNSKALIAALIAGSAGSFGGHQIGSNDTNTLVDTSTIESCREFSLHARSHERASCELEKIKILMDKKSRIQ